MATSCGAHLTTPVGDVSLAAGLARARRYGVECGAGLMQDPASQLSELRSVAGLLRSGAFPWRRHNDDRYQGYRLVADVDPDVDASGC